MVQSEEQVRQRCVQIARYMIETGATVRRAGEKFGVSKSTVHKDVTQRLLHVHPEMQRLVKEILQQNKSERHLRGGEATRRKYCEKKE